MLIKRRVEFEKSGLKFHDLGKKHSLGIQQDISTMLFCLVLFIILAH